MSPFQAFRGCSKGRNLPVAVAAIMTSQFENVPASHDVDVACCFRNSSYEVDLRYYVSVTRFLPLIYVLPNSRQNHPILFRIFPHFIMTSPQAFHARSRPGQAVPSQTQPAAPILVLPLGCVSIARDGYCQQTVH